jgi:uncharacterized protein YodC (DUF2158 family)
MIKGEKFIAGNAVRLISGGPLMTIDSWDSQRLQYLCNWFDGNKLMSNYFNEDSLTYSAEEKGMGMEAWVL